jgi:ABC-type multidrug transport system permease subunit
VVACLRRVAAAGRTVVCTIHQPSAELFDNFDELLLLSPGGWQVYCGSRADAVAYLSSLVGHPALPSLRPLQQGRNPASWLLHVTQVGGGGGGKHNHHEASDGDNDSATPASPSTAAAAAAANAAMGSAFQAAFRASAHFPSLSTPTPKMVPPVDGAAHDVDAISNMATPHAALPSAQAGFVAQVGRLALRFLRAQWRNSESVEGRVAGLTLVCFIFGLVHLNLDTGGVAGTQTLVGLLVNSASIIAVIPAQVALAAMYNERATAARELAAGVYSPLALCVATLVAESLSLLVTLPAPAAMLYFMAGLRPEVFGTFIAAIGALALWFLAVVAVAAVVSPKLSSAQTLIIFALLAATLFSGLFVPASNMSPALRWLHDINPLGFASEALVASQVHGDGVSIDVIVPGLGGGVVATVPREAFVADVFGFKHGNEGADIGYILVWTAGLLVAYVIAAHKVKLSSR